MTVRTLALDTTSEFGSMALLEGDQLLEEVLLHSRNGFGQVLFEQLERLLERGGFSVSDLDCFAVASGPGSFTGVRVGLAAVKGMASTLAKPVVAVSSLQAVASFADSPLRAACLDARRGEVYAAVYNSSLNCVQKEVVTTFPEWLASLPDEPLTFLSTDFSPYRQALIGTRFADAPILEAPRALAGAIGRIAFTRFVAGEGVDAALIDANYVRRSDAERFWKDA